VRRPWLAFLLSLIIPGLGQLYAGEPWRAAVALFWTTVLLPPAALALVAHLSTSAPMFLLAIGITLAVYVLIPIDAALMARWNRERPRRWCNRPVVYVAYVVLFLVASFSARASVPRTMWYQMFRVPSASMAPLLLPGDHIVGDMRALTTERLRRGDVLLVLAPGSALRAKRLIGIEGDSIELRDGALWVNGASRSRAAGSGVEGVEGARVEWLEAGEYVVSTAGDRLGSYGPVTVPPGHVFVMGDSRGGSDDCRSWGPLPMESVRGRMVRVHLSFEPPGTSAAGLGRVRWGRIGIAPARPVDSGVSSP
jgi:signal peptidase I